MSEIKLYYPMKKLIVIFITATFILAWNSPAISQCAMCKANVQTNMDGKQGVVSKKLNTGILYLLSVPYIMGGIGLFVWWKKKKEMENNLN